MGSGRHAYVVLAAAAFAAAMAGILAWVFGPPATYGRVRPLGEFILYSTFDLFRKAFWAGSPEAVTATVWDYRGLDTVFETTVLYAAIAGCAALAYVEVRGGFKGVGAGVTAAGGEGLTVVVKAASKILFALILITSLNIALHGYITPGGGFAGGSTFAVAPLVLLAAYSLNALVRAGLTLPRSSVLRSLGLVVLAAVVLAPLAYYGFALQNQPKPGSGFPGYPVFAGPLFLGGSLLYLNLSEFLVVGMEFVMVFTLFTLLDKAFESVRGSGGGGGVG